jgi:AcrR family transcriptional regulator
VHRRAPDSDQATTRERILDVALDLFIDQGFDKTSLREIAQQLGLTKAAVYYHFASKDDILLALHLRLHTVFTELLDQMEPDRGKGLAAWEPVLEGLVDSMIANRRLFVMHDRNRAAFENLHERHHHTGEAEEFEGRIRDALADPALSTRERVRLACSLGALTFAIALASESLTDVPSDELATILRETVGDLLKPPVRSR